MLLRMIRNRPSVAVVLGGGMFEDGSPSEATLLRADAASWLAHERNEVSMVILAGKGPDNKPSRITEASVMSDLLIREGVTWMPLRMEDESVDTIGNVVLVAARYLHHMRTGRLFVVTSPFHMERALLMFRKTLNRHWQVLPFESAVAADDAQRAVTESGGIAWAQSFFDGIEPGDLPAIITRLQQERPYYSGIDWLKPERFRPTRWQRVLRKLYERFARSA